MLSMLEPLSTYVEMFMDNSMIWWNYSKLEAIYHTRTIFFSEIMLIEVITLSKQYACFSVSKLDLKKDSPYLEEIMNQEQLHKTMAFTMSVWENIKIIMFGKCLHNCLIICHLLQWSKDKSSELMEVYHQILKL